MSDKNRYCKNHGLLGVDDYRTIMSHDTDPARVRYRCKKCVKAVDDRRRALAKEQRDSRALNEPIKLNKICVNHGELLAKDIYIDTKGYTGCRTCKKESKKASDYKYRKRNLAAERNRQLNKYNLTTIEYNEMLGRQNHCCDICKQPETLMRRGVIVPLSVDHCHRAEIQGIMKVRGLLCKKCNSGIALMNDSIETLRSAIEYLKKNQSDTYEEQAIN